VAAHHERQRRRAALLPAPRIRFRLARLNAGAVDEARARLKPELPAVGEYGIPIRDELVLEKEPR
jgi:hypothetical protein